ncbi:DUF2141 domain-containing protein [Ekhidna sp.]|uniref:DUF2141 domain-containing protein n=1 Tax=Ekhidna sp. TaxID=2608089 RepID=UPI003B5096E2
MRIPITILLIISSICVFSQHKLTINLTNIAKVKGQVEICVYEEGKGFMNSSKAKACIWKEVLSNQLSHTFENLPAGKYAAIVIQDLNGNKDLDTNFLRIPNEPYGFSTNPSTTFGPPDFDGASFMIASDTEIRIELK